MKTLATTHPTRPRRRGPAVGRLARLLPILLVLGAGSVHAGTEPAPAAPPCLGDRFLLDEPALPPDATIAESAAIDVVVADDGTALVHLDGCAPASGTARVRRKATVVRARIEGCSTTPFRVWLKLARTCERLAGLGKQHGEVVATFAGRPSRCGDGVIDEAAGESCETPGERGCSDTCGAPAADDPGDDVVDDSTGDPDSTILAVSENAPRITQLLPSSGRPGDVITLRGEHFDHERDGGTWTGTPPWRVVFSRQPAGLSVAIFTVVSPTELRVTVPANAKTGPIFLEQAARIFEEQSLFAHGPVDFVIETDDAVVDPTTPPGGTTTAGPVLRVVNANQYDLIDLRLNGQQVVTSAALATPPGAAIEIPFLSGGQVSIHAGNGLGDVLFTFDVTAIVAPSGTTTVTVPAVSLGQLLTNFQSQRNFSTDLFLGNDGQFHVLSLRFTAGGGWQQILDGAQVLESGVALLASWPPNGLVVQFNMRPGESVSMPFPWSSFLFRGQVYTAQ